MNKRQKNKLITTWTNIGALVGMYFGMYFLIEWYEPLLIIVLSLVFQKVINLIYYKNEE